jgi:hypothetical protein
LEAIDGLNDISGKLVLKGIAEEDMEAAAVEFDAKLTDTCVFVSAVVIPCRFNINLQRG